MSKILWFNTKSHLSTIEGNQNLADLFHDICVLVTNKTNDSYDASQVLDCRVSKMFGYESHYKIDDEELGIKLIELKDEIKKALINAKKEGIKEGKNLLKQLNQGNITLTDFESL